MTPVRIWQRQCAHASVHGELRQWKFHRIGRMYGLTEQLRFFKIPQLKLDCQLVAQGYDDDLERRRQESFRFASGQRKPTDKATIFLNDAITFDKEPYTYRRAMMDRWI